MILVSDSTADLTVPDLRPSLPYQLIQLGVSKKYGSTSTDPDALDLRTALYLFWPGLVGLRQIYAKLIYLQIQCAYYGRFASFLYAAGIFFVKATKEATTEQFKLRRYWYQCSKSACFWASRIRILPSPSKNSKKTSPNC